MSRFKSTEDTHKIKYKDYNKLIFSRIFSNNNKGFLRQTFITIIHL